MIIPDGDRALKRLWYAKKKMAVIKMHDLPAKATLYEGFTIKVWRQGELEGGFIKSPMGMVVVHMGEDGPTMCVADFWMGAVNYKSLMHNLVINPAGQQVATGRFVNGDLSEQIELGNYEILPSKMVPSQIFKVTTPYGGFDPASAYQDQWCKPLVVPFVGEAFWVGACGMHWYDPDGNGLWNETKWITELLFNFYNSDGSQEKRTSCFQEVGTLGFVYPSRIYQGMPRYTETVQELNDDGILVDVDYELSRLGHIHTVDYDRDDSDVAYVGSWFEFSHKRMNYNKWSVPTIVAGVPNSTLRGLMNDAAKPHGNYQFAIDDGEVQQVHCMNSWYDYVPTGGVMSEFSTFFGANPSLVGYRYTVFKWSNNGSIYTFPFTDFLPLLESLCTDPIETTPGNYDMRVVHYIMGQIFPYPNDNWTAPPDSVMFHSHSGNVYTWTRYYGTIQISNSGLAAYTLYLPTEVTANDGVRPDIAYAGSEKYTLIAYKPGKLTEPFTDADWIGVRGIFLGTPFEADSWRKLPDPPTGFRIRCARPVSTGIKDIPGHPDDGDPIWGEFVGIAEQYQLIGDQTELPKYKFRACYIRYEEVDDLTDTWAGEWQIMTPVPIENVDWIDQFDVGFFGSGSTVDTMRNHPDPPNIMPNITIQPYDNFSGNLP